METPKCCSDRAISLCVEPAGCGAVAAKPGPERRHEHEVEGAIEQGRLAGLVVVEQAREQLDHGRQLGVVPHDDHGWERLEERATEFTVDAIAAAHGDRRSRRVIAPGVHAEEVGHARGVGKQRMADLVRVDPHLGTGRGGVGEEVGVWTAHERHVAGDEFDRLGVGRNDPGGAAHESDHRDSARDPR